METYSKTLIAKETFRKKACKLIEANALNELKQLCNFFSKEISFSDVIPYKCIYFCLKLVQHNEYLVSTVDADGLVL